MIEIPIPPLKELRALLAESMRETKRLRELLKVAERLAVDRQYFKDLRESKQETAP